MKVARLLAIVSVLATAGVMMFDVGSAAAVTELEEVVLCEAEEEPCLGKDIGSGAEIEGELESGTKAVILGGIFGNIECTGLSLTGKTTELLANGLIESMSFSGCTHAGGACTATTEHLPYALKAELSANHTEYELEASSSGSGEPQIHVTCPGVNCTFSAPLFRYKVLFNPTGIVIDLLVELNRNGGFCPSTSVFHIKIPIRWRRLGSIIRGWFRMR